MWSIRIHELAAALELYLIEMRRVEDKRGYQHKTVRRGEDPPPVPAKCEAGACGHYPRLVLDPHSTTPPLVKPEGEGKLFYLTQREISHHLSGAYGAADCFDHPLVFARSGWPLPDDDVGEEGQQLLAELLEGDADWEEEASQRFGPNHEDNAEWRGPVYVDETAPQAVGAPSTPDEGATSVTGTGSASGYLRDAAGPPSAQSALPGVETVGGLLALGRILLTFASQVNNLSLTGIFHRLFCGPVSIEMPALRSLSIGPLLLYWKIAFSPRLVGSFSALENIRICTGTLTDVEVGLLAGESGALPRLRHIEWEMVDAHDPSAR